MGVSTELSVLNNKLTERQGTSFNIWFQFLALLFITIQSQTLVYNNYMHLFCV